MKCSLTSSMERSKKKLSPGTILALSVAAALVAATLSLCLGAVNVSLSDIIATLGGECDSASARILLYVRLPRTLGAFFAGAGLAGAGVIIQSVLNNPLAGPNIIGVNAGAGLCAVLCCALLPSVPQIVPLASFAGAMAAMLLVYNVAKKTGASKITIVLAGVAINSILNAGTDVVTTIYPDALIGGHSYSIGGLSGVSTKMLLPAGALIVLALLSAYLMRNELDVLALGEEMAASLGLSVKLFRFLLLLAAACLAGASVSFAGLLGFVGLIVPHAARFMVGSETRWLLPVSAAAGAAFLILCDIIARTLFSPYELPVGIILSFLGGPFFIWLLLRRKGGASV